MRERVSPLQLRSKFNPVVVSICVTFSFVRKMATPCSPARSYYSSSHYSSTHESNSQCRSPLSDCTPHDVFCRKLFDDEENLDDGRSKISIATFADTRKKLSFPSPEVSELHQHLQALDGLDGQAKWPFSRKHHYTPNTSPKKKLGPFSIERIAAEIRAIETRTTELHFDQSLRNNNAASKKQKLWLCSLGFISLTSVCLILFFVMPIILSSRTR